MLKRAALATSALLFSTPALADGHATQIVTSHHSFLLTQVAAPLEHPWGLDWLPGGRMLVTERPGALRLVSDQGDISEPLSGLPEITSDFRDGFLDVAIGPSFDSDRMIYFTYSALKDGKRWLVLSSAELHEDGLQTVQAIFEADVKVDKDQGFGSRIRFADDGSMYVTVGDHALAANAQDLANSLGTVIRLMPDGSSHPDNPLRAMTASTAPSTPMASRIHRVLPFIQRHRRSGRLITVPSAAARSTPLKPVEITAGPTGRLATAMTHQVPTKPMLEISSSRFSPGASRRLWLSQV